MSDCSDEPRRRAARSVTADEFTADAARELSRRKAEPLVDSMVESIRKAAEHGDRGCLLTEVASWTHDRDNRLRTAVEDLESRGFTVDERRKSRGDSVYIEFYARW